MKTPQNKTGIEPEPRSGSPDAVVGAPAWLLQREGITQRQWKSQKRAELKAVAKALSVYRMGCAYCPGRNGEMGVLETVMTSLIRQHSMKHWGR